MSQTHLSVASIERTLSNALAQGLIREMDTAAIFYDLDFLATRIGHLTQCFPSSALHGLAIKANPLLKILEFTKEIARNTGVEAASVGEVCLALKAGYPPGRIVFDSPVKTYEDLRFALSAGIHINADNIAELERIRRIIGPDAESYSGTIGLRINPQIGLGTILESSVAGEYSKFGVPIRYCRPELEHVLSSYPWLTGLHLHVGSQGCAPEMLAGGIGILYDFALEMNEKRRDIGYPPICIFDIGGGLPVSYKAEEKPPSMSEYADMIRKRAPLLFDQGSFRMITEFGRWTYTNAGWTVSRVEYVKRDPSVNTAMLHVGADLFVRECLNPRDWQHEYSVFDCRGVRKHGPDVNPYNLAGPLCFSGDIIAKGVPLPRIEEGDYLVIHDTGGYTFSMWSRYNSRQTPRIIGCRDGGFEILKEREGVEEVGDFWE